MRRASASGSFGKPARIQSAWKARSARPTGRPAATPRAIRSAPPIGSLGSGASARNRPAAAKASSEGEACASACARASASRAASRPAVNRRVRRPWNDGGASIPCRAIRAAAADRSRPASALAKSQPLARPLRVLFDRNGERGQPQDRVRPEAPRGFDRDKAAQAPRIADAAEDRLEEAALAHRPHDLARAGRGEELDQFGAHPLAREPPKAIARPDRGGEAVAVEPARGVSGREPEEAENAQVVLADARVRVADEAHPPRREVLEPADRIVDRSVGAERQRVDGEVAPLGVAREVAAEPDSRPSPVGLDILAQRRRLDRASVDDDRHRAVLDAGQRDLEPRRPRPANCLAGNSGGREVEIERRFAKREVPHRAADKPRLLARAVERGERAGERAFAQDASGP